jgi:16S rRNA (guanine527-N7)-methyltransferase
MEHFDIMNIACGKVKVEFNETKYNKFIKYKEMIKEWNEKINLTAITEDNDIIQKHFIDCIEAFKFQYLKEAKNLIDVGTGGGFPGIPIKILNDNINVVLLDSLNKRINFLNEVISALELKDIKTIHGRAEDFAKDKDYRESFDIATSRAVANMTVLSEFCIPYVKVGGYFLALKGPAIEDELKEAKNAIGTLGGKIQEIIEVEIENSDIKHNLVIIKKIKATDIKYPRKAGMVTKKPIR